MSADRQIRFLSDGLPSAGVEVVHVRAQERLGQPYEMVITLLIDDTKVDFDQLLQAPASLEIMRELEWFPFHGVLASIEQMHEVRTAGESGNQALYRAVLVPRLWNLSLVTNSRVFLDLPVPKVIENVLADHGLTAADFEFRLGGDYPPLEFVCQYQETDLAFIQRWMEREGIYFFFGQSEGRDRVIFVDDYSAHPSYAQDPTVWYRKDDGTHTPGEYDLMSFIAKQTPVPHEVVLKNYSYRHANMENLVRADVSASGRGTHYVYGERFETPAEGKRLAEIRAQQIACMSQLFFGESRNTGLHNGSTFFMRGHYRAAFNRKYLIIEVEHEGHQFTALGAVLAESLGMDAAAPGYMNRFTAIPHDVQFRPARLVPWPKISGTLSGHVVGTGSQQWADMDEQGRYKVRLPFDISGSPNQSASHWIRKAQPSGGGGTGTNFPLPPNTEVLLNFIDGDPDRPEIIGTVTNSADAGIITAANQSRSGIRSTGGNQIAMEDTPDHSHVGIMAGNGKSRFVVGSGSADRVELHSDWGAMSATTAGGLSAGIANTLLSGMSASLSAGFIGKQIVDQILKTIESTFLSFWSGKLTAERADPDKAQRDLDKAITKENETKTAYDAANLPGERAALQAKQAEVDAKATELTTAISEQATAEAARDAANGILHQKQEAARTAAAAVAQAQTALLAAQSAEAHAQQALAADPANAALQAAHQAAIADRQAKAQALASAQAAKQTADTAVTAARTDLATKQSTLDTKTTARKTREAELATKEAAYRVASVDFATKDADARQKEADYFAAVSARKAAEKAKEEADSGYNKIGKPILMTALPVVQALLMYFAGELNSKMVANLKGKSPDVDSSKDFLQDFQAVLTTFTQTMAKGNAAGLMASEKGVSLGLDATKKNITIGNMRGSIISYSDFDIFHVAKASSYTMAKKWWMVVKDATGKYVWNVTGKGVTGEIDDTHKLVHAPQEFFVQMRNGQIGIVDDTQKAHAQIASPVVYLLTKPHTKTTEVELHAREGAGTILIAATDNPEKAEPDSGVTIKMAKDGKLTAYASDTFAVKAKKSVTIEGTETGVTIEGKTTKISGDDIVIDAKKSIKLKVGATEIELTTDKLTMKAGEVKVTGGQFVKFFGAQVDIQ